MNVIVFMRRRGGCQSQRKKNDLTMSHAKHMKLKVTKENRPVNTMDIPNADDLEELVRKKFLATFSEFITENARSIINGETCQCWVDEDEEMSFEMYYYICEELDKKGYKAEIDWNCNKMEGWMSISKKEK